MTRGSVLHRTRARDYTVHYDARNLPVDRVVFNERMTSRMCLSCVNFDRKWSCPPVPSDRPGERYGGVLLYWMWIDASDIGGIDTGGYVRVRAINSILVSLTNRVGLALSAVMDGPFYSSGSCRVCRKCSYPDPCIHPDEAYRSLESVGVDVGRTLRRLGFRLCWYGKRKPRQNYTHGTVVCGVFTDLDGGEDILDRLVKRLDMSAGTGLGAWS